MNNKTQNPDSKTLSFARFSVLLQLFKTLNPKYSVQKYILLFLLITNPQNNQSLKPNLYYAKSKKPKSSQSQSQTVDSIILHDNPPWKPNPDSPKSKKLKSIQHSPSGQSQQSQNVDSILPGLPDDLALDCLTITSRSDYPSLSSTNKKLNSLISTGYLYKLRQDLNIVENWIYMASSLMPWTAFDPSRRTFNALPRIPCDECFKCADKESLCVGTRLLVFGREISGLIIYMYNLVNNKWSTCRPMINGRCLFGSGSLNGLAVLAGGIDLTGRVLNSAELYDSNTDTWAPLPDLNIARRMCAGFFMDGKFYVIGGMDANRQWLTCGEEFDFSTRVWRRVLNMYPALNGDYHQSPPLIAVVNDNLYLADKETNVVKKYDKVNNYWHVVNDLPVRADSLRGWGIAFKGCGDRLIVIKGQWLNLGEGIVIYSWRPDNNNNNNDNNNNNNDGGGDLEREWEILGERDRAGSFVYNCAVMGC